MSSHSQSSYESLREDCVYCDKELHNSDDLEKHLRICEVYKQMVHFNGNERGFGHKGAKPRHPKISEYVIPKAGKCTYCKTTLNKDILLHHEKDCLHKEIRCPHCYSTMLLKDSDKHHCKSPKRKDKVEKDFDHKEAKLEHSEVSQIVIPKAVKCTYCKTPLNKDILLYHEKECLYKEIRCPDCYSTMLLKDCDKHHCKSPKRKDKGSGGRRTQKVEKFESNNVWLPSFPSLFGSNKSNVRPTLDEHQNDRNEFNKTHMMARRPSPGVKKDEDLYFAQHSKMDEPIIPSEFFDELLPASAVVLHTENVVKPKVAKCSYCKTTLNDNILLFHEKECVYQPTKCPDCSATMLLKDADSHFCKPAKENNKVSEIDLLSKNFKDLFTDENCWDTVLQVGSKEFKAHRTILIARSSVFSAMFQHDTSEKQTGLIKVPDCDPDTFKEFLEYLYCGKLENISSDCALHLYTISDKYNVQELKSFCAKYLMQNITTENICEVAILADTYDETELFSAVQDFFNKNFKEIVMISVWEDLFKKNFRLANKLLIGKAKVE